LAEGLNKSAATQLANGRPAKALELWNRVLAFDPENVAVTEALRRLEGRRRIRQAAAIAGLAALLGGGAWLAARHARTSAVATAPAVAWIAPASPRPGAAPTATGPMVAPALPARTRAIPPPARTPRARAEAHGTPAAPAHEAVPPRVFTLGPTPQNVDVYLDGQRQFPYDPNHTTIEVPWDSDHVLEFRSPGGCCFVERVELGPDRPLPADSIIARRLKWRPARLLVTIEPAVESARVLVRDPKRKVTATTARAGEEIEVPFFVGDSSSKEVEIAVDAEGAFTTAKVVVRAGQRATTLVKLKPSAN
jgi:hypothetical protein